MGAAMMIGVAQVIGMKPTLRSVFSSAPGAAKTSVAVLSGKNCESAAGGVLREYRTHDRRGDDTLVALFLGLSGDALQLLARLMFVLRLAAMPPTGAAIDQPPVGIKRIFESRHDRTPPSSPRRV